MFWKKKESTYKTDVAYNKLIDNKIAGVKKRMAGTVNKLGNSYWTEEKLIWVRMIACLELILESNSSTDIATYSSKLGNKYWTEEELWVLMIATYYK